MYKFTILIFTCFIILSCHSDQKRIVKSEQLEIYKMVEEGGEFVKGSMIFSESKVFDEKGNMLDHKLRQRDNTLHSEKFVYDKDLLNRSNYYDESNNMLSYYTYEFSNGLMSIKKSFDASNDELLRIEEFEYNEKKQLIKKLIKTPEGNLSRSMAFSYDENANENQLTTRDANGSIITNEEYQVLSYDVDKRWTERWSLDQGTPLTFQNRILDYYE